jgi:hypothetical protein
MADWLTYADIEQLRQLQRHYGGDVNTHSKHQLICSLLHRLGKSSELVRQMELLSQAEARFVELLVLDPSLSHTMEDLLAKGRAALGGNNGEPRSLIMAMLKRGWLFPGYSFRTQNLYHVPSDLRQEIIQYLTEPHRRPEHLLAGMPSVYRDEQFLLVEDLSHFLRFVGREVVRLTQDGAIYKHQQKQLFKELAVPEEPVSGKEPRFGFGRRFHQYPDRFSLLYDYAYHQGYIREDEEGTLCLTEVGTGKMIDKEDEGKGLYRFWIRLYRRPLPHLPVLLRWVALLAHPGWIRLERVARAVHPWIAPYYYESEERLFDRVVRMLVHLGVMRMGMEGEETLVTLSESGVKWMQGVSAFRERVIDDHFVTSASSAGK